MIVIDATGATAGMDFEAFIKGGFLAGTTGGLPKWDNGNAFTGQEMMFSYGTTAESKFALAHGEGITYSFNPYHQVYGTATTLEFGTRGTGSYDANGFFVGGNVELKITGLNLTSQNPTTPEIAAENATSGGLNNFALAYMSGSKASEKSLSVFADALQKDAQHFLGSAFGDTYKGTSHADIIEGNLGIDTLRGGAGDDLINGGKDRDFLWGDDGADSFAYFKKGDSKVKKADVINDFSQAQGDKIDLSGLKGKYDYMGTDKFSGDHREVRYAHKNGNTIVKVDTDGDGRADMKIKILTKIDLTEGDFVL